MKNKLKDFLIVLRPHQWYKNLVVFLALIFSGSFSDIHYVWISLLGFFLLIILSSANYIFNDLMDYKRDLLNPEKRKRPIASGKIKKAHAFLLALLLLFVALISSWFLSPSFFYVLLFIFLMTSTYSLFLKKFIFVDIITISALFILRAVSGAVLIKVAASQWLIIGVFFLAMFLVTGKRYGELVYLEKEASNHRNVLKDYTKEIFFSLFNVFMAIIIITFALYSFFSVYKLIIWTIPLFTYLVLRYYYLILTSGEIARNPDEVIKDLPFMIIGLLFIIINMYVIIY